MATNSDNGALLACMVGVYCRGNHKLPDGRKRALDNPCEHCSELLAYAQERLQRCPHMQYRDFCQFCPTHCYRPGKREQMLAVMRYSGPRMLLHRPADALRHLQALCKHRLRPAAKRSHL